MSLTLKEIKRKKPIKIAGVVVTLVGIAVLLLQFFTMTTQVEGIHIGPFKTSAEAKTTFPISPYLIGIILAVGIAMFLFGHKKKL